MRSDDNTEIKGAASLREITEKDYQAVEATVGISSPNEHFRQRLIGCMKATLHQLEHGPRAIRDDDVTQALEDYRDDARQLLNRMIDPPGVESDTSPKFWAYEYAAMQLGIETKGDPLKLRLRKIIEDADLILEFAPKKGKPGTARDQVFADLADRLTYLYEATTGSKAGISYHGKYTGPFFRFVREFRKRFVPEISKSDSALGKALQTQLTRRRERLGMD